MDFINEWIVPPGAPSGPVEYIALSIVALLLTAVSKGGFGGGVGILSVPLMLQVAPDANFVIGLWLPILITCDACTIRHYPREWNPKAFWHLTPGMLLGIVVATILLWIANTPDATGHKPGTATLDFALKISIAVISLAFLGLQLRGNKVENAEPWKPTWLIAIPTGFVAGITTLIAHAAGPIITMFLLPQKMEPRVFLGTCGRYFFIFNSIKVPFMIAAGAMTWQTSRYGLWLMALSPLGVWLGAWLNTKVSAKWFVRIVQISLVIAAAKLMYDTLKPQNALPPTPVEKALPKV